MHHLGSLLLGLVAAGAAWGQLPTLVEQNPEAAYTLSEAQAPADAAKALRDRVELFFSYHVGTLNRRAFDLVAEDTKDYYFASGKNQLLGYKVLELKFAPGFTKALVKVETTQTWRVQELSTQVTTPANTTWVIEDGKWMWHYDLPGEKPHMATPMGLSAATPKTEIAKVNADGTLPEGFAKPENLMAQSMTILDQASVDQSSLAFTMGTKQEQIVTLRNNYSGPVSLQLSGTSGLIGFTFRLEKSDLAARENGVLHVSYDPAAAPAPIEFSVRIQLLPFGREFPIAIALRRP
jgi:hypothetical protein